MARPLLKHHKLLDGSGKAPPNSFEALEVCLDASALAIEFDIRAAADGRFVLMHDATLERETTACGAVADIVSDHFTSIALRDSESNGTTLDRVVERLLAHDRPTKVQIDLKETLPLPEPLLQVLAEAVTTLGSNPRLEVVVGCLGDWNLRKLRRAVPTVGLGFDPLIYLDKPQSLTDRSNRRVNAYGYFDDHPLGYRQWIPPADYLRERVEGLVEGFPHARECYLRASLVLAALDDGVDLVAVTRAVRPDILVDLWTVDAVTAEEQADLHRLLTLHPDQITTNRALDLAAMIA